MGHSSSPVRWAERRAIRTCDEVDRERGRESEEVEGALLDKGDSFEEYSMEVNAFGMDDWLD